MKGRLELIKSISNILRDNPLGDPHERTVPVYLPPSWGKVPGTSIPVIYYLAGFTGTGRTVINEHPWKENLVERLDRLIAEKKVRECAMILPDCFTRYGGSQYINSEATGRYEDYVVREIVYDVEGRCGVGGHSSRRAVMGKSSGGYGAIVLGMRRPDVFGHVASHSGDMYFEMCYGMDFPKCVNALEKYGSGFAGFLKEFNAAPAYRRNDFPHELVNLAGMASSYAPAAKTKWGFEIPFDERTGEIIGRVWSRWLKHDPVRLISRYNANLRKLKTLYFDCGRKDEFFIHLGSRIFSRELAKAGIAHAYEEHDKGHFDTADRYDVSLVRLSNAFG